MSDAPRSEPSSSIQPAPPTLGPWYVGDDIAKDCPDHANSGLALVDTGREYDWPIARLVEWNNAHLIAAAPDLLAACMEFLPILERQLASVDIGGAAKPSNAFHVASARVERMRAAIAKASPAKRTP